jgi:hypothetical protein
VARYVIEASHTKEDCVALLDAILRAGAHYLTSTDWGCEDGVHTAWLIVEADSHDEARLMVPPVMRNGAQLVALNKFTPAQVRAFHEEAGKA